VHEIQKKSWSLKSHLLCLNGIALKTNKKSAIFLKTADIQTLFESVSIQAISQTVHNFMQHYSDAEMAFSICFVGSAYC